MSNDGGGGLRIRVSADLFRIAYACVSKEETRYYLNGVYIEPHPEGGAILTSTDGHRLLSIHDPEGWVHESAIVQVSKEFLGLCKSGKEIPRQLFVQDGAATVKEAETPIGFAAGCIIDGQYPDWRFVVPTFDGSVVAAASFRPGYVSDFAKVGKALAKVLDGEYADMRILTDAALGPALVLWPSIHSAFGVLMPVRTDDALAAPEFFKTSGTDPRARPRPTGKPEGEEDAEADDDGQGDLEDSIAAAAANEAVGEGDKANAGAPAGA